LRQRTTAAGACMQAHICSTAAASVPAAHSAQPRGSDRLPAVF
jgi:hypothetical protein